MATDNFNANAKLDLRRKLIAELDVPKLRVLDCCAGEGVMWRALRGEYPVEGYLACDLDRKEGAITMDSRRLLSIPGWQFNFVDIDTYGVPWKHFAPLLENMPHNQRTAVALTVGCVSGLGARMEKKTAEMLGLDSICGKIPATIQSAVTRAYGIPINLATIFAHDVKCLGCWQVENEDFRGSGRWGGNAEYIGLILQKS